MNIIIFVLFIYFIVLIRNDIIAYSSLMDQKQRLIFSLKQEETLKVNLESQMSLLEREDYIEGVARRELGLVKSGEKAYKIIR